MYGKLSFILDLFIRALSLGGKFVVVLIIAKLLTPEDLGVYGIFGALISYLLYFLGMDFYTYSTRDIIKNTDLPIWEKLYNQYLFFIFNYLLLVFLGKYIFASANLEAYTKLGVILAVSEHASQEIYRVLVAIGKVRVANIQYFIRVGGWCYVVAAFTFFLRYPTVYDIFTIWLYFSLSSFIFGLYYICKYDAPKLEYFKVNLRWIQIGIKTSLFFFVGTIFIRGVFYFDKIIIQHFSSVNFVGVYVFFFGISAAIQSFVDIMVVSRYFPKFIQECLVKYHARDRLGIIATISKFKNKIILVALTLSILSIPCAFILSKVLNKDDYINLFLVYILMLISNFISLICAPFHYFLYSINKDTVIVLVNIFSFFSFLTVSLILSVINPAFSIYFVVLGVLISNVFVFFIKKKKSDNIIGVL